MNTPLDAARGYIGRGWNPVAVRYRTKAPTDDEWQNHIINEENVDEYFNGKAQNIGIVLGPTSGGLTDVDLDCDEAIEIAPDLLPPTGAIFGRPSKRMSHRLYITDLAGTMGKGVLRFQDPTSKGDRSTLVELRAGGQRGAQTIFPGSVHESGEPVEWVTEGEPTKIDGNELRRAVSDLAAAALLVRHWPGVGQRHDTALALGGLLGSAGYDEAKIEKFVSVIAKAARDPEVSDRIKAATDAAAARAEGDKAYGLPKLIELLGKPVAKRVAEWLGLEVVTSRGKQGNTASGPSRAGSVGWINRCLTTNNGTPRAILANVMTALRSDPALQHIVAFIDPAWMILNYAA